MHHKAKKSASSLVAYSASLLCAFLFLNITGCAFGMGKDGTGQPTVMAAEASPTAFQPVMNGLFLSAGVPAEWRQLLVDKTGVKITDGADTAEMKLSQTAPEGNESLLGVYNQIYAVVVPFPTVDDEITVAEIYDLWNGKVSEDYDGLTISEGTRVVFIEFFGSEPSNLVEIVNEDEFEKGDWQSATSLSILPFEQLNPRWKVLKINGISPLDKPMRVDEYPLTIRYYLVSAKENESQSAALADSIAGVLPATNRDESKMTVVVMSGTTALVRTTAYKIDNHGVDYPISEIKDWFSSADIRHVSNEISFNEDCPEPNPWTTSLRFCSDVKYLPVLLNLGVNVVELTGNHLNDYGPEKLAETTAIYQENGINYYGGGNNLVDARKPLTLTSNGNKIAFIGCNFVGPKTDFATTDAAGSAPCDFDWLLSQIAELKADGYTVITTYQHNEVYVYMFDEVYQTAFIDAALAGADIVQGSQAHFPMGFEFSGMSLIHYGLGNFLFDQMDYPVDGTRREFIDRHIIYDGKYINTEILTALLTDWSKPVPMTVNERAQFLTDIFKASKMR